MNEETPNEPQIDPTEESMPEPTSTTPEAPAEESPAPTAVMDPTPEPAVRAEPVGPDAHGWWRGTGRRKTAVARVRIKNGSGTFKINNRDLEDYFTEERDLKNIRNVLEKTDVRDALEIHVKTHGGGFMGQAGAVILGLGRALLKYDTSLEPILRSNGFLTRDAREVERKKYGQPGARRRFQFSKR